MLISTQELYLPNLMLYHASSKHQSTQIRLHLHDHGGHYSHDILLKFIASHPKNLSSLKKKSTTSTRQDLKFQTLLYIYSPELSARSE
jgi:hypothetical protein